MGANIVVDVQAVNPAGGMRGAYAPVELTAPGAEDITLFQDALSRNMGGASAMVSAPAGAHGDGLGSQLIGRAHDLAGGMLQDQQYVSRMLEQASRSGDSMQLMKAMMALNDYQVRVQTISKTVSKATSAIDQLTKLQ